MAGATNRAFKAAGIPKAAVKELRVTGGRGLTLRSAISLAEKRGIAIGDKPKAFLAKRDERMAAMKAAKRAPESPALARMRDAKARVGELRAARDERRERMGRMRRKVEFARETKAMERTLNSPEMRAAVERAEMGYGPNAARREAKGLLRRAMQSVRDARRAQQGANELAALARAKAADHVAKAQEYRAQAKAISSLKSADTAKYRRKRGSYFAKAKAELDRARLAIQESDTIRRRPASQVADALAFAADFRGAAKKERRHATLVDRAQALRELADERIPFSRNRAKKETGFSPSWLK